LLCHRDHSGCVHRPNGLSPRTLPNFKSMYLLLISFLPALGPNTQAAPCTTNRFSVTTLPVLLSSFPSYMILLCPIYVRLHPPDPSGGLAKFLRSNKSSPCAAWISQNPSETSSIYRHSVFRCYPLVAYNLIHLSIRCGSRILCDLSAWWKIRFKLASISLATFFGSSKLLILFSRGLFYSSP
jgi:hypothetical protein